MNGNKKVGIGFICYGCSLTQFQKNVFFASVNNLLDEVFKTGGFEQGRNANYRELRNDKALDTPVFGSKYWYGRGATYFLNVNIPYKSRFYMIKHQKK